MQISLQKINQQPNQQLIVKESIQLDELVDEVLGLEQIEPVQVEAIFQNVGSRLYHGEVKESTQAVLTCSRCLTGYTMPLQAEWSERFTDEESRAIDSEEEIVHLVEAQTIDLDPYIREALILTIPFAPLCREDCKGLCPVCGANKNVRECSCVTERIDPRLAALQDLFKE
ncbi:uncharacterized protein J2Z48_001542 [Croceifilum oryzae]|uniref:DUF177 domain-containing protein n=1 Tax=Croceifilum oryzae TaxID=1553429 RepID=A0AAJ1TFB4_9BACL|nr:DUF177 domain-containing protein [Croceifilum oryzae]MDQ0417369.1 uncharacterized protein [Croceifilum oryzae]